MEWFTSTEDLRNYSFVFPFETKLDRVDFFLRSHTTWIISIWVSILYVTLVFVGQRVMAQRKAFVLRKPLIAWNAGMAVFSFLGFIRVSPELFRTISTHGLLFSVCVTSYGRDPVAAFWISAFVTSKFVELLDTAFIVLRKRPLLFLHWYHHVTVLLFAWHSAKEVSATGRWYAWMNYGVHSFMYAYFAVRAMKFHTPEWMRIFVTALQISQMAAGVTISYVVYRSKTKWRASCHQTWSNLTFAGVIYFTYFILFLVYFYDAYIKPRLTPKVEGKKEEKKVM